MARGNGFAVLVAGGIAVAVMRGMGGAAYTPAAVPQSVPAAHGATGSYTAASWARAFITGAGYKPTRCNMGGVVAWIRAEGSDPAWRNPLDDTLPLPGSSPVNGDGVQSYRGNGGLRAALFTLQFHPAIKSALAAGDDAQAVADAVQQPSTSGHYWGTRPFTAGC